MINPLVTIIIPSYNHERFIKQRIESVLNQSFQDYELILIDDASIDGSLEILDQYKNHPKVTHFIVNAINSGSPFKTWQQGIALAQGQYVWIAESDDYSDHRFLETTLKPLDGNATLGMVFTDSVKVDAHDDPKGLASESVIFNDLKAQNNIINKYNLSRFLLKHFLILNVSSVLFRKDALMKLDYSTLVKFNNTGDRFTYLSIAFEHDLLFIDAPLNHMRLHNTNTTTINIKNGLIYKDRLLILDYFMKPLFSLESNYSDLIFYFKKLYLPCIDFNYNKGIRRLLRAYHRYNLLNFKAFIILHIYSYLPFEFEFLRTKVKDVIRKL